MGQEPSQSLTKTLHHSDTSQHKAWELDSAVQCKNAAFLIRKKFLSLSLNRKNVRVLKNTAGYYFPSPCVGIVTDVMTHHQLFSI